MHVCVHMCVLGGGGGGACVHCDALTGGFRLPSNARYCRNTNEQSECQNPHKPYSILVALAPLQPASIYLLYVCWS